ncbi:DsrE family protein [Thioclava sp.]|uniref:DsrE family protein n=1 Tax=Thioclava sp. TaxID=1933450 RepID=UPI003AA958CB
MSRMSRLLVASTLALGLGVSGAFAATSDASAKMTWVNPVVKDYGRMHPAPYGALQPNPDKTWKVVFDVNNGSNDSDGVNSALWHVARAVNVYAEAGVDHEHRKFAVVLHGGATKDALSAAAYKAKFGHDDPNTKLIKELAAAGVHFYICGQALADNGFTPDQVSSHVDVALSALAAVPVLESEGYQLFEM